MLAQAKQQNLGTSVILFLSFFALYIYTSKKFGQAKKNHLPLNECIVIPYFHYCSPAWSNAAPFGLNKINKK